MRNAGGKLMIVVLIAVYAGAGALGMVLVRKGGMESTFRLEGGRLSISVSAGLIAGVCLYLVSFAVWLYILQLFPLTYISPVAYGIVFMLSAFFSDMLLGERITKEQLTGGIFIILGVLIAGRKTF